MVFGFPSKKWSEPSTFVGSKRIRACNVKPTLKIFFLEFSIQWIWLPNTLQRWGFERTMKGNLYIIYYENMCISFFSDSNIDILKMVSFKSKKIKCFSNSMFLSQNISLLPKEVICGLPIHWKKKKKTRYAEKAEGLIEMLFLFWILTLIRSLSVVKDLKATKVYQTVTIHWTVHEPRGQFHQTGFVVRTS